MAVNGVREFDLSLSVAEFGATKMLRATSRQMPKLLVIGTDDDDLWDCLRPVITDMIEADGERVQSMILDKSKGPRNIRVHLEVSN